MRGFAITTLRSFERESYVGTVLDGLDLGFHFSLSTSRLSTALVGQASRRIKCVGALETSLMRCSFVVREREREKFSWNLLTRFLVRFIAVILAVLVAFASAQGVSPVCKQDLSNILDEIINVAQEIGQTQSACANPNSTQCVPDINNVIDSFGNLTIQITAVAKDCFGATGNSTLCAKLVLVAVGDLDKVTTDATAAVKACSVNPKGDNCVLDLQAVSSEATKSVVDLSSAIAYCSGAASIPSLFEISAISRARAPAPLRTFKKLIK